MIPINNTNLILKDKISIAINRSRNKLLFQIALAGNESSKVDHIFFIFLAKYQSMK